jgi:hypothetical protein
MVAAEAAPITLLGYNHNAKQNAIKVETPAITTAKRTFSNGGFKDCCC